MGQVEVVIRGREGRRQAPACRRLLTRLLRRTGHDACDVTVLLAPDAVPRRLNRTFMGRDRTTDVLSFPSGGELEPGRPHLGEIAISIGAAARQARRARWPLSSEMALLVTHGFLHLLGYDHARDDGTMRRLEEDLLRRVAGVTLDDRRRPWGAPGRKSPSRQGSGG